MSMLQSGIWRHDWMRSAAEQRAVRLYRASRHFLHIIIRVQVETIVVIDVRNIVLQVVRELRRLLAGRLVHC